MFLAVKVIHVDIFVSEHLVTILAVDGLLLLVGLLESRNQAFRIFFIKFWVKLVDNGIDVY